MSFQNVSHVIFDLDGLLIDSERVYTEAFTKVSAKYGKTFTWEINATLLGFQAHEAADKVIKSLDIPVDREQFMKECLEVHEKHFHEVQLMPGARRLIEHLYKKGIPFAMATSSCSESVKLKMQNHQDILKLFNHIVMGSTDPEVEKGKPDPSIFLVCASRFLDKPAPEKCLVFEDAVNGVKAANAANMQVIAVPDPRIPEEELKTATLILKSLENFKPELFGLPAYD